MNQLSRPLFRQVLTRVINASGTYTNVGVSRSSQRVCRHVGYALRQFIVMDELRNVASEIISEVTGAEAAAVTHCVSAGITLSIAAAMAGHAPHLVAALPDTSGLPNRVVLPAGHVVNHGHSILQDIRLAGGKPIIAGTESRCTLHDIDRALAHVDTACLLLVSSWLVRGDMPDLADAVGSAQYRGVPAIIDGAAQDFRIKELLSTGADLVLVSGHKYLASPTAGLVLGRHSLVTGVRAHENGIGRAMKSTKEAIVGVLAALKDRESLDVSLWRRTQDEKVIDFTQKASFLNGVRAEAVPDPAGMPFSRVRLCIDPLTTGMDAKSAARNLKAGTPPIWVMEHELDKGNLVLELVPLVPTEIDLIIRRLQWLLDAGARLE